MATQTNKVLTNDRAGFDTIRYRVSGGTAGTLNGTAKFGFAVPPGSWRVTTVTLSVGTNTTHNASSPAITVDVAPSDGGTSALTTLPKLQDTAGTGAKNTTVAGTGITVGVPKTTDAALFVHGQYIFVTVAEVGTGGTDPADVFFVVELTKDSDFDAKA